jgi:hypothetical protein
MATVCSQIDRDQQKVHRNIYDEMDAKALVVPNGVHGRFPGMDSDIVHHSAGLAEPLPTDLGEVRRLPPSSTTTVRKQLSTDRLTAEMVWVIADNNERCMRTYSPHIERPGKGRVRAYATSGIGQSEFR